MNEIIKEILKGVRLNSDYISKVRKDRETLEYMNSLDFESMPQEIKEMNMSILNRAKKSIEDIKEKLVLNEDGAFCAECINYASSWKGAGRLEEISKDINCIDSISGSDMIELTAEVRSVLEDLKKDRLEELDSLKKDIVSHIESVVSSELFETRKEEAAPDQPPAAARQRDFIVRKSSMSPDEIRDIVQEYIKVNEQIFNKIIFESKPPTLSVADRVLDVYFKPGTGYVVNFISEPDTNYGKFYRNLLKVFGEIRDRIYDDHEIVIAPEDGKSISYLNSFYQNYIFVREKIDTALTQYRLQNSMLNENFSVKYMIFEKISGKYLILYTGNRELSKAVAQYFTNQAKLGTMQFELEFVEYGGDIRHTVMQRLEKIRNKIELNDSDNYMKVNRFKEQSWGSLLFTVSGVKILIDPEIDYPGNDLDIVVMTNARYGHVDLIPSVMGRNPSAKLFTSDISFRIARIKWLKELNSPALVPDGHDRTEYSRKDVESLNDRVIRITPMGKGYNFKNLVNIKFFFSGSVPGASVIEIRDASHRTIYTGVYSKEGTSLLEGSDIDIGGYDILYYPGMASYPYTPLPAEKIREKIGQGKQVFIFSDRIGNLQHSVTDLYTAGITGSVISGDTAFDQINKELSKMVSFGSSWGDNIIDRELFHKAVSAVEPFTDEYEFYKKFSLNEPLIFILPFDKMELEMVMKNKLYSDNLIFIPAEKEEEFARLVENDPVIPDEYKTGRHTVYNYIRRTQLSDMVPPVKRPGKKIITDSEAQELKGLDTIKIPYNSETKIY